MGCGKKQLNAGSEVDPLMAQKPAEEDPKVAIEKMNQLCRSMDLPINRPPQESLQEMLQNPPTTADINPVTKKLYTPRQIDHYLMRVRGKLARLKFFQDLTHMPKMLPGKLILIIGLGMAVASIDMSIVSIALPLIRQDKNFLVTPVEGVYNKIIDMSTLQWINDLYSISFAAFAVPAGKIGDRFGTTVVLRYGIVIFTVFSALCGCSHFIMVPKIEYFGFWVLAIARFFQGIGAAFLMANTMALCSIMVRQEHIPKAMAYNSLAFSAGSALGPPIGGLIAGAGENTWIYAFLMNIPLGIICLVAGWVCLPKVPKFIEEKFDFVGALLILIGLIIFVLGLVFLVPEHNCIWLGPILIVLGIGSIVGFVFWELRHPFPIFPRSLFTNKKLIMNLMAGFFNFALICANSFQLPFALQNVRGYSAIVVGLISLASPIAQIASSFLASWMSKKVTSFITKIAASVLIAVAVLCLSFACQTHLAVIIIVNIVFSFVLGIFFTSNNVFMMQVATPDIRSVIGSSIQVFREAGFVLGISLVSLCNDLYMSGRNWEDNFPAMDDYETRNTLAWKTYEKNYFNGFLVTDGVMAALSIIACIFSYLAGVADSEVNLKGFPKKLRAKILAKQETLDHEDPAEHLNVPSTDEQNQEIEKKLDDEEELLNKEAETAETVEVDGPPTEKKEIFMF